MLKSIISVLAILGSLTAIQANASVNCDKVQKAAESAGVIYQHCTVNFGGSITLTQPEVYVEGQVHAVLGEADSASALCIALFGSDKKTFSTENMVTDGGLAKLSIDTKGYSAEAKATLITNYTGLSKITCFER